MRAILTIWKKELKDTIRDRRTMVSMVVMPLLLMPALLMGVGKLAAYQTSASKERTATIMLQDRESSPFLAAFLEGQKKLKIVDVSGSPEDAVRSGRVDAAVIVPPAAAVSLQKRLQVKVTIIADSTKQSSSEASAKVATAIALFDGQVGAERLKSYGLDARLLSPLTIENQDAATAKERGGFGLGFILPMFLVIWAMVGGQYIAMDISAGEKERKTLEALLLTPTKRREIVIGKFLAVSTAAGISVLVALGSLYFAMSRLDFLTMAQTSGQSGGAALKAGQNLAFSIEPLAIAIMITIGLLLVFLFSAVQLSIAIFARSYKEAQSYIGPAYLVVTLPLVIVNIMPNLKVSTAMFLIPVINAVLVFKEALVGAYSAQHILTTIVSLFVCAALAIAGATFVYEKEKVLFR
jgi:sodium transport system permease protein